MGIFKTPTVSTTSDRYSSFLVTETSYGSPLSIVYGTTMVAPVLIDYDDFTAIAHTTTTKSGGKGGSVKTSNTTYTYTVMAIMALGEGICTGVGTVWSGSTTTDLGSENLTFFNGAQAQSVWGYLTTNHANKALTYSGTCYVAGVIDLGDSSSLPNYNFEVYGKCQSQSETPTTSKVFQCAYQKTIKFSNYDYSSSHSSGYVEEYVYGSGWVTINSRYYTVAQQTDAYGNKVSNKYTYTFNFDDRTDGYDRADPNYIRIHYTATSASVSYTATDANPRDVVYDLLTNSVYGENFPYQLIDDLSDYSTYCQDMGILISPAYTSQRQFSDILTTLMESTNSAYVFSEGKVKLIPYHSDLEPIYDIEDDNLLDDGDNSLTIARTNPSDVYNVVPLEYLDRDNSYNTGMVYATDEGDKDIRGLRQKDTLSHHEITSSSVAQTVAQIILQKQLIIRNQYTVTLGQEFVLLEPMDAVTLAVSLAGLDTTAVRVVEIKENSKDYSLTITFEDNPSGMTTDPEYETQDMTRGELNVMSDPGNVNQPVITEMPAELLTSTSGLEAWIFVCGSGEWYGGCNIWLSEDGNTYQKVGSISGNSREGILTTALPSATDPDTTDTLSINMSMSGSTLTSGTQSDLDNYNTLCYVDGELISYKTATLTGTNTYALTDLHRGVYGTTISAHKINSQFARVAGAYFVYPFKVEDIGKTIYIKCTAINVFGKAEQELSDVGAFQYILLGTAEFTALDEVSNVAISYSNNNAVLSWDLLSDFRSPIVYEIRCGETMETASVVGTVSSNSFTCPKDGKYYIYGLYKIIFNGTTYKIYSSSPATVKVTNSSIQSNVIATYDEATTDWSGTHDDTIIYGTTNQLSLGGTGDFDAIPDFDEIFSLDMYGGLSTAGTYTIPSSHIIETASAQSLNASVSVTGSIVPMYNYVDDWSDIDSRSTWDGTDPAQGSFTPQINVAGNDGVYSGWQDFVPGQYYGKYFNFRLVMDVYNTNYILLVSSFAYSIDVQDIVESANVSINASATTIAYSSSFNMTPTPTITIFNGSSGDEVFLTGQTQTGFTIQIKNNGVGVARNINYVAKGW